VVARLFPSIFLLPAKKKYFFATANGTITRLNSTISVEPKGGVAVVVPLLPKDFLLLSLDSTFLQN
jgi:hypothetical protein